MNEKQRKWLMFGAACVAIVGITGSTVWWNVHRDSSPVIVENPGKQQPPTKTPTEEAKPPVEKPPSGQTPAPPAPTTPKPQPKPPQEKPGDTSKYTNLAHDVLIELDEEPRLHSPLETYVAPTDETYTLLFRNPMSRASVESTIKSNLQSAYQDPNAAPIQLALAFRWINDHELKLSVTVPRDIEKRLYSGANYRLSVKGAKTKGGLTLSNPPAFTAIFKKPEQLWRVASDNRGQEQMTWLTEPYHLNVLKNDRYLLLERPTDYCCHAPYERLDSIYDTLSKQRVAYPIDLMTNYMGPGDLVADRRGFFYASQGNAVQVPKSDTAVSIKVDGYVHGAIFSKDGAYVVLAVGKQDQEGNYDLIIRNLNTGAQHRFPQVLKFNYPPDLAHGVKFPLPIVDDGKNVYFVMAQPVSNPSDPYAFPYRYHRYQYSWQTQQLSEWQAPVSPQYGGSFLPSDDGVYRMYLYDGLYKGDQKITDQAHSTQGAWLGSLHQYAFMRVHDHNNLDLEVYDVGNNKFTTLISHLPMESMVAGASSSGRWIYVRSSGNLVEID